VQVVVARMNAHQWTNLTQVANHHCSSISLFWREITSFNLLSSKLKGKTLGADINREKPMQTRERAQK
jgi:hypothetical protein